MEKRSQQVDDGGQYDCEIEADGDLPISVSHRLDILLPPRVIVYFTTNLVINIIVTKCSMIKKILMATSLCRL